jgi:hypothetical protein
MKSLMLFLDQLIAECGERCGIESTTRDSKTIASRFEHEGFAFYAITLPRFGKEFEKALDQGYVDRHLFTGYRRKGELPQFLGGFLDLVFDRSSGVLLDYLSWPSTQLIKSGYEDMFDKGIDAIRSIRQITRLFGKIELPVSEARISKEWAAFIKCEKEVTEWDASVLDGSLESDLDSFSVALHGFFSIVVFPKWIERSMTEKYDLITGLEPLLTSLWETTSGKTVSGPQGWKYSLNIEECYPALGSIH